MGKTRKKWIRYSERVDPDDLLHTDVFLFGRHCAVGPAQVMAMTSGRKKLWFLSLNLYYERWPSGCDLAISEGHNERIVHPRTRKWPQIWCTDRLPETMTRPNFHVLRGSQNFQRKGNHGNERLQKNGKWRGGIKEQQGVRGFLVVKVDVSVHSDHK